MHQFTVIRRVALGAALAGVAIGVVPAMASAASSCTLDTSAKTMTVTNDAPGGAPMTLRSAFRLTYSDGTGPERQCFSPTNGEAASAFNTTKIRVRAATGAAFQDTVIDEHSGRFVTAAGKRMTFAITTGTGSDHLGVRLGNELNQVRVRTASSGLAFGPDIDLDTNGVSDIVMTAAGLVSIDGGGGSDLLNGTGSNTFQLELLGGASGNDTLRGGGLTDFLGGGTGNDTIVSSGDKKQDFVDGGPDTDHAFVDVPLDSVTSIEDLDL